MMDRRYSTCEEKDVGISTTPQKNYRISPSRNFGQEKLRELLENCLTGKRYDSWIKVIDEQSMDLGKRNLSVKHSLSLPMKNKIHSLKRKSLFIELNVYPKNKFRSFYYQILISNYPLEITRWHTNEKIRTSKVK